MDRLPRGPQEDDRSELNGTAISTPGLIKHEIDTSHRSERRRRSWDLNPLEDIGSQPQHRRSREHMGRGVNLAEHEVLAQDAVAGSKKGRGKRRFSEMP